MKGDIIYLLVYLATELFNYLLAYVVIFGSIITKDKKKIILAAAIIAGIHFPLLYFAGEETASGVSMFSMCIIPALLLEPIEKKNFLLYPFVVIGTSVVGFSVSFLLAVIMNIPEYMIAEGNWLTIICQSVQGLALLILAVYKKLKKNQSYVVCLGWRQYLLFYIVVICLFLMLAPIQIFTRGTLSYKDVNIIGFAVSVACIVLVIVTIYLGVVINRENLMKERNQMNEKYMKLQKDYYVGILKQDEELRRFRHDMNAHFTVLQSYCEKNGNEEVKAYLNRIIEESAVYAMKPYTGNHGVDAIIRQLDNKAKEQNIQIQTEGYLPDELKIEEYDLCTIIFNLLKNAIEACEKISEVSQRKVLLQTGEYNSLVFIQIKNTVAAPVMIENNHLVSTKKDTRNHGLGSGNVESMVEKYQGIIEYQCKDGWFTAEVSI